MDNLQAVIDEIQKRLDTNFGGSEDYELGRRAELSYLLLFVLNLSKQKPNYVYTTSTGKEFMREATKEEQESIDNYIKSISSSTGINFNDIISNKRGPAIVDES